MFKNWLKYFLYFFAPMTVLMLIWLVFSFSTGGGLSISEKGAGLALLGFCALLAGGCSLWVVLKVTGPTEHLFRAITPFDKNEVQNKLEQIFNSDELPISQIALRNSEIYAAHISIFWGIKERISLSSNDNGIVLIAPKKIIDVIVPVI